MRNEPGKPRMGHGAAPGEPENLVRSSDARPLETRALKARQRGRGGGREAAAGAVDPRQDRARLQRRPNGRRAEFPRQLDNHRQNRGMQVKMFMRSDVIQRETGGAKGLELGADLRSHLLAHMRQKKYGGPGERHIRTKAPAPIEEIRHSRGRQNGLRVDQRQMQPDREPRQPARQFDRCRGRRRSDHQARRGEDAFHMRALNGAVDFIGEPEIIGRDDKIFQCAISRRSRRKRKNSIPSRRRRFSMSGLVAISPTIAAILPGRK